MATTTAVRHRPGSAQRHQTRAAWLLILPFLIVFAGMFVVPLAYSAYLSTFTSQLVGGTVFSGLDNYSRALHDPSVWAGLWRVAVVLVVQVTLGLGASLGFALALDSGRLRGSKLARLLIFLPFAVPSVVATLMWGYLYGNDFGLITQVFEAVGLPPPDLLSSDKILGSTINILMWEFIGYNMIILYAALRSIPTELYEAAEVDGASAWRIARHIKIPAIQPAILLTVIFSIIGCLQLFNEPRLLWNIAPTAIGNDFTPNLYAYNVAFKNLDTNYAAAIAFLLGFVIAVISYVVQTRAARTETQR